jgi:hypothetical protein
VGEWKHWPSERRVWSAWEKMREIACVGTWRVFEGNGTERKAPHMTAALGSILGIVLSIAS